MSATKFVVLLLIGLVCANVGAIRQLVEGSEETTISISVPKTSTANGIGAELSEVIVYTSAREYGCGNANATSPKGPSGKASGCGYGDTSGYVIARGIKPSAYSKSTAYGRGNADAAAGPNGAGARGNGTGGGTTIAYGRTQR